MYSEEFVRTVLRDYTKRLDLTVHQIASKHGVPYATLLSWTRRHKVQRRDRGRRPRKEPTLRQKHILGLATLYSYAEVGRMIGHGRSDVWRIVQRWGKPKGVAEAPFAVGDVIAFSTRPGAATYTVLRAGVATGQVRGPDGVVHDDFSWWRHKVMARKVVPVAPKPVPTPINSVQL